MSWFCRSQPCHFSLLPLLIPLSLVFFLALFSFSPGHHSRNLLQSAKFTDVNKINGDRRWVGEEASTRNSTMVLAKDRTHRKDPSDNFNYYNGGWAITDSHYWASASYSALPLFVIAVVWFIVFGLTLFITCIWYCCCCHKKSSHNFSQTCFKLSLFFFAFFTLTSIVGCIFLYVGQGKFHTSTRNTLDYVVSEADETSKNLTAVSNYLDSAKRIGIQGLTLPDDIQTKIIDIQKKADSAARDVAQQTHHNNKRIKKIVNIVRDTLIGVATVMFLLALAGFLFSLWEAQCLVYILAILGWILITAALIMSGVFLLLHNVVGDTCIAMDEWVRNPTVHTTLDDILPCVDKATAQDILLKSKGINQQLISLLDSVISNVSNIDVPPATGPPIYYNQSGPKLPLLCTPYNPDLTDRTCAPGEVDFSNATQVWKNYVCKVGADNATCITTGRLTPTYYDQAINAANVSYGLYTYTPFLVQLADCTFVRRTFEDVSKIYCWGLQKYTKWVYIGLSFVSFSGMFSLFSWSLYTRERRHRGSRS